VYSDVCLRYRVRKMLCTVMCEVQGEGKGTVQLSVVGFGLDCYSEWV